MKKGAKIAKSKKKTAAKRVNTGQKSDFKIKPLGDRILIRPFLQEETNTTSSGIIIPDTVSKEKPERGEVLAVGDGRFEGGKLIPVSVKVGDKVVFSRYGYEEIKIDGEEYYILKEDSILAVIK